MVRALAHTAQTYLASLKKHGSTLPFRNNRNVRCGMLDFDSLNELLETRKLLALGAGYDAGTFKVENDSSCNTRGHQRKIGTDRR